MISSPQKIDIGQNSLSVKILLILAPIFITTDTIAQDSNIDRQICFDSTYVKYIELRNNTEDDSGTIISTSIVIAVQDGGGVGTFLSFYGENRQNNDGLSEGNAYAEKLYDILSTAMLQKLPIKIYDNSQKVVACSNSLSYSRVSIGLCIFEDECFTPYL